VTYWDVDPSVSVPSWALSVSVSVERTVARGSVTVIALAVLVELEAKVTLPFSSTVAEAGATTVSKRRLSRVSIVHPKTVVSAASWIR